MAFFTWKDEMSVGIPGIDQQHQKLVGFLNELYDAMQAGKGGEALGRVLTQLLLYTRTHFADEERLMETHRYPEFPRHKEKHARMAQKVKELCDQFHRGQLANPLQITNFLKEWLARHIMETDKQYGPFLAAKGVK